MRDSCRLVGECQEEGGDPSAWRLRLLEGLSRFVGGSNGAAGEARWVGEPRVFTRTWGPVETGPMDPRQRLEFHQYATQDKTPTDSVYARLAKIRAPLVTRSRSQLLDDHFWYGSDYCEACRRLVGFDDFIFSAHELDGSGEVNVIGLNRPYGDRPFSVRDRRLVHVLHLELARLIGTRLARGASAAKRQRLSPRMRQTLDCLLDGDGEKQAARRLGLSLPTVHQYVTALYRHFGVSGRSQLMALWIRRGQAPNPPGDRT